MGAFNGGSIAAVHVACGAELHVERRDDGYFCAHCGGCVLPTPTLAERRARAVQFLGLGSGQPDDDPPTPDEEAAALGG